MRVQRNFCELMAVRVLVALGFAVVTSATAGDLVDHNGFEACWSKAITQPQFLSVEQSAIDGVTSCIPQSTGTGYSACSLPKCANNAVGCPVTTHAGAFAGAFSAGSTNHHTSTGSTDTITLDVAYSLNSSCTVTISNVALGYALDYTFQVDGNNGLYAASLDQSTLTVQNGYMLVGSDLFCQTLVTVFASTLISQVETAGAAGIAALELPTTVGESVCPLTP